MKPLTNEEMLSMLRSGEKTQREQVMRYLYRDMYDQVRHYVLKNEGNEDDAGDVFQDSLVALYELSQREKLESIQNLKAYFFRICRNIWLKKLKRSSIFSPMPEHETQAMNLEDMPVDHQLSKEQKEILNELLDQLGDSCKQILLYYYYHRMRMQEIMLRMEFGSEQVAKNKKSNCLKKLRALIKDNPYIRDIFR